MNSPPLRYRLLIALLSPVFVVFVLWKAWRIRSKRFAYQRLGFGFRPNATVDTGKPLWIHCASVGEVTAALPLIDRLRGDYPDVHILVSTTTPTGAVTIQRKQWARVQHIYLPVDTTRAISRLFAAYSPTALIIMETELWPNLINKAAELQIPIVIVNGRLSQKTLRVPAWFKVVYQQALSKVTVILAKSDEDANAFLFLGAAIDQVSVVGNIKFAAVPAVAGDTPCDINKPFWLAASTHEDEELQLCKALLSAAEGELPASTMLVIAPRHPERSEKVQEALRGLSINFSVRSKDQPIDSLTQVYLADRLGEMGMWLSHAEVVFMGGSLVPVGGHNLLEPAAAALPIVSGPYLENVLEEAEILLACGSLQQVDSATEVLQRVMALLSEPLRRAELGVAGRQAVLANADVLQRYLDALRLHITVE